MPEVTATDMMRTRTVENQTQLIREHLEAMQRDAHGLEFGPWKLEIDELWKRTFEQINRMSPAPQQRALQSIRELWTSYVTHYSVIAV
jgi:hypothetical protein